MGRMRPMRIETHRSHKFHRSHKSIGTNVVMANNKPHVLDFSEVGAGDVALVGGKCASLGELFRELTTQGVRCGRWFFDDQPRLSTCCSKPTVFAKSSRSFLKVSTSTISNELARVGSEARRLMLETPFPERSRGGDPRRIQATWVSGSARRRLRSPCVRRRRPKTFPTHRSPDSRTRF